MLESNVGESILTKIEIVRFYLFSGDLRLLHFLIILMILDIFTGLAKAVKNQNLWSRKSLFGFARKLMVFCIIILSNIIDQILQLQGGLVLITIMFYICNEGLSILENCAQLGVLVPKEIAEKLALIRNSSESTSFSTQIKEEFSVKHSNDLPGGQLDVQVRVEPESVDKLRNDNYGPEVYSNGKRTNNEV